jgi:hypothetical protein
MTLFRWSPYALCPAAIRSSTVPSYFRGDDAVAVASPVRISDFRTSERQRCGRELPEQRSELVDHGF